MMRIAILLIHQSWYRVLRFVWPYFATFWNKYNIVVFPSLMNSSRFDGFGSVKRFENYMTHPTNFVTKATTILNIFIREQN